MYRFVLALALVLFSVPMTGVVEAAQSNSSNYQVNEVFFGSGGELHACGTAYCSKQSAGELAVGRFSSSNYQAHAGFNTERMPFIEMTVSNTDIDLGTLNTTTTKTATSTFSIKSYLSHGYSVVNASDPPKNGNYTMQAITIPDGSTVGTEQFGVNLVANTLPVSFGSDPVQDPDNSFSFGLVGADYSSPNLYKYVKGDTVAHSVSSTSATQYTVSYIFNVSGVTPGGTYVMRHVLVGTSTF